MSFYDHVFCKLEEWELYGTPMLCGWYFWDETDAFCHGPFSNREECILVMTEYAESL